MEMNLRKWRYAVPFAAFALAFACSDGNGPTDPFGGKNGPVFDAAEPANGEGRCMIDDAVANPSFTDGWNSKSDPTKANNCTTNDVRLANARATAYSLDGGATFIALQPGEDLQCVGGFATIKLVADLVQTSSSQRNDFGVWLRTDDGTQYPFINADGKEIGARSGECNHYNLTTDPPAFGATVNGVTNHDGDACGDMTNQATVSGFDLGEITIPCIVTENQELELQSCIGWKVPGDLSNKLPLSPGDKGHCPAYENTGTNKNPIFTVVDDGADGFRAGTLPGNTSKCNCEALPLGVFVAPATITVVKECTSGSGPDFSFTGIGPSGAVAVSDLACGGSEQVVSTNTDFGAYSFTEGADPTGWTFVSAECVNGSDPTASGRSAGATIQSGDAVVCTFTNRPIEPATITIEKVCQDGTGGSFSFTGTGPGGGAVPVSDLACGGSEEVVSTNTNFGVYNFTEGADPTGWAFVSASCSGGSAQTSGGRSAGATIAEGDDVTCTFINRKLAPPTLTLVKEVDNTGGGTALATDWELCAEAGVATDFCEMAAGGAAVASVGPKDVTPDEAYLLSELGPGGYEASAWSCTGDIGGFDATTSTITLQFEESAECTIVNTFIPQQEGEWCSPGFWANNFYKHDGSAWADLNDANKLYSTLDNELAGVSKPPLKTGGDATLIEILGNPGDPNDGPQVYGGPAFNYVGIYLSLQAGLDVQLDEEGNPIHNCPFNQQGETP